MTSMVSTEAKGQVYRRVLVLAEIQDLGMMQQAELAMKAAADEKIRSGLGTRVCDPICRSPGGLAPEAAFIPAHTLLFPGREYSPEEIQSILRENRIDATLVLSPTSSGVSETYVPPTFVTNCSTWRSTTSCSSTPVGGTTLSRPWVTFAARLYDAKTGATAWIATSSTNGSAMSGPATLITSMAQRTLNNLIADSIVM
jgi:hypothetical protein